MGPFFVGQVPGRPMVLNITDDAGNQVDLTDYTTVELRITNSRGQAVDTAQGFLSIVVPAAGQVQYVWPSASLFTAAGDYTFQLVLGDGATVQDMTVIGEFEVRRPLQEVTP